VTQLRERYIIIIIIIIIIIKERAVGKRELLGNLLSLLRGVNLLLLLRDVNDCVCVVFICIVRFM